MALRDTRGLKKAKPSFKGKTRRRSVGAGILYALALRVRCPACFKELRDPFTGEPFQWDWAPPDQLVSTGCSSKVVCPCGFTSRIPRRQHVIRALGLLPMQTSVSPSKALHFGAHASPEDKAVMLRFLEQGYPILLKTMNTGFANRTGEVRTPGNAQALPRRFTHDMKPVKKRLLLCGTRRTGRWLRR